MTEAAGDKAREMSVTRLLTVSVLARIVVDTGVQMFNPFLPIIAGGLGTNVVVMGRLVALRSAMGLFSPVFGAAADRRSYRRVLQLGLFLGSLGMAMVGISRTVWMAVPGMILCGLGFAAFVPTLQAYVSARLPYSRRARGLGILEYSWAITGILGLYLLGQLIEYSSWRAPFFVLSAGMLVFAVVFGILPPVQRDATEQPAEAAAHPAIRKRRIARFFDLGDNARSAYGAIGVSSLTMFAAIQFMIIYGAWLYAEYGLTAGQLGTVALVFGLFDLTASVSVSLFTDRIGKWRSVFVGVVGAFAGYLLIPWFNFGALPAILALGITRGFFEFAIVSNIPLLSEQVPSQRGKVMTLSAAFALAAVTIANFTGPWLYTEFGVFAVSVVAATSSALAVLTLLVFVIEPGG